MITTPKAELAKLHKDYYILLENSLLGKRFDIIRCVSTRQGSTFIIKENGEQHWFAASMEYGVKEKWFIPYSHTEFAKIAVKKALIKRDKKGK